MLSNLVLQDTINGIRNITKCELTIVNLDGMTGASPKRPADGTTGATAGNQTGKQ